MATDHESEDAAGWSGVLSRVETTPFVWLREDGQWMIGDDEAPEGYELPL